MNRVVRTTHEVSPSQTISNEFAYDANRNPSLIRFGEAVSGFHLVDGRASFGIGLQFFFLGYPLHFDWSKLTDLKVSSAGTRFDFWIGFDF